MTVFTDFHHAGLLQSLILLFEKRLGMPVYRPIGEEWHTEGFWKVYDHPATVKQYLSVEPYKPVDGTPALNEIQYGLPGQIYACKDIPSGETNNAITLEGFKTLKPDFVIASIPQHIEPFRRLIQTYSPESKLIFQIGNSWNVDQATASKLDGIMASATIPLGQNLTGHNGQPLIAVIYHQEFDLEIFAPQLPDEFGFPLQNIYSFMNCPESFPEWGLFNVLEKMMPDYSFKAYGGQARDGIMQGDKALAEKMAQALFVWHVKRHGDGYGHILHNSFAIGRPVITRLEDYAGKLGGRLLKDGETCIAIDGLSANEIVLKIQHFAEAERYKQMTRNVYNTFRETLDFQKDELNISAFLNHIKGGDHEKTRSSNQS